MEKLKKRILLSSPTTHGEELFYIKEAFEKNWLAPLGFNCDIFEEDISNYIGGSMPEKYYSLSLNSGTAALHLAIKLAGIKSGDIVLCSDMTFSATVNPISYEGGIQVFVDSERDTWNIDPSALEKAIAKYPQAKALVMVHLYGTPAKMDEILEICKNNNILLIEDSAEALSSSYKGRQCGSFGKYSIISFNGNKIITTSGGGMLLTRDKNAREKAFFWATQARENTLWYQHEEIGYNYRMSNVLAGIGRGQMKYLSEHRNLKQKIYINYKEGFIKENLPVTMNPYLNYTSPNHWLSCMLINKNCKKDPIEIVKKLNELNIESRPLWKPMHMQPVFSGCDNIYTEKIPVSEDVFSRGLCLPSDIKMTEEEQNYVIKAIKACF